VHYALKYKELRKKMDKQLILSILFIFIGVLILTIHSIYVSLNSTSIYGEVFDIMAWVFVWEAVQTLFVDSLDNRRDLRMYTLLYMAQPELYDKK
jgi:drug/metabolite transporter (DMT)-like permease